MNDDSSLDGGRFDTGAMADLDPMVDFIFLSKKKQPISIRFLLV